MSRRGRSGRTNGRTKAKSSRKIIARITAKEENISISGSIERKQRKSTAFKLKITV